MYQIVESLLSNNYKDKFKNVNDKIYSNNVIKTIFNYLDYNGYIYISDIDGDIKNTINPLKLFKYTEDGTLTYISNEYLELLFVPSLKIQKHILQQIDNFNINTYNGNKRLLSLDFNFLYKDERLSPEMTSLTIDYNQIKKIIPCKYINIPEITIFTSVKNKFLLKNFKLETDGNIIFYNNYAQFSVYAFENCIINSKNLYFNEISSLQTRGISTKLNTCIIRGNFPDFFIKHLSGLNRTISGGEIHFEASIIYPTLYPSDIYKNTLWKNGLSNVNGYLLEAAITWLIPLLFLKKKTIELTFDDIIKYMPIKGENFNAISTLNSFLNLPLIKSFEKCIFTFNRTINNKYTLIYYPKKKLFIFK